MKDIAEIRKLPIPERLQLVSDIWDSIIDDPTLLSVSDQLARELELRLACLGCSQLFDPNLIALL